MLDFLRDSIWDGVGGLIGIVGVIFAFYSYFKEKKIKKLSYQVLTDSTLITNFSNYDGKMKILFENEVLDDASIKLVKIVNNGKIPIHTNEFETPIFLRFGSLDENKEVKIIYAEKEFSNPNNLNYSITINRNTVYLAPLLLNPNDEISIKVITSDGYFMGVDARISGIKQIELIQSKDNDSKEVFYAVLAGIVVEIINTFLSFYFADKYEVIKLQNTQWYWFALAIGVINRVLVLAIIFLGFKLIDKLKRFTNYFFQ